MKNNRNLTFPLANMVAGSSNEPTANSADRDRGFEIYFQGAADRQPDVLNNSSSSVQMNQSLVYTTPEVRSDQGSQSSTSNLPGQRFFLRFSDNDNSGQNPYNFWIRGDTIDQLQPKPLAVQTHVPVSAPRQNHGNSPSNRNSPVIRMFYDPATNSLQRQRLANSVPPFVPPLPPIAPTLRSMSYFPTPSGAPVPHFPSFVPPPTPPPSSAPNISPVAGPDFVDRFLQSSVDPALQQNQSGFSYNGGQEFYNNNIFREAGTI